jgi:hypothetical protein
MSCFLFFLTMLKSFKELFLVFFTMLKSFKELFLVFFTLVDYSSKYIIL